MTHSSRCLALAVVLCAVTQAEPSPAHVGSPEVLHEGDAGPYHLRVALSPPVAVPGQAHVQFRTTSTDLETLEVVPTVMHQERYAPPAERAQRDERDPRMFSADVWIMTPGTWKVRIHARGGRGEGELSLPVPALPPPVRQMRMPLAAALSAAALALLVAALAIVRAAAREARLAPGESATADDERRGRRATLAAGAVLGLVVLGITAWWNDTDRLYAGMTYRPTGMTAWVDDAGRLFARLEDPGWLSRRPDDLVADHGHLMHLYAVRLPDLDRALHLHPDLESPGLFARDLPALPAGRYRLFGDFVHQTGLAETAVAELELPDVPGKPLVGDDASRELPPWPRALAGAPVTLEDGTVMRFAPSETLVAGQVRTLGFRVTTSDGATVALEPYLGMLGHLAVIAHDLSVFSHVHPSGTVPMAALAVAQSVTAVSECAPSDAGAAAPGVSSDSVAFPYLFPHAGGYRLIVQIKRAGRVLTGAFDVQVSAP